MESGACADGVRARFAGHVVESEPQVGATLSQDLLHSSEVFTGGESDHPFKIRNPEMRGRRILGLDWVNRLGE